MGLAVSLGFLADLKVNDEEGYEWAKSMFAKLDEFVRSEGHSGWSEPEEIDSLTMRRHVSSFPYSFIHYLRRAYAHEFERPDEELQPTGPEGLTAQDEALIDDAGSMFDSHLLCHSDCEGFYLPLDFGDPLFAIDGQGIPGDIVGSSHGLLRELRAVAGAIGIELVDGELSDAQAHQLYEVPEDHPWNREYIVFLTLWEAASASIRHNTAIVFA